VNRPQFLADNDLNEQTFFVSTGMEAAHEITVAQLRGVRQTILHVTMYECGSAPPIYRLGSVLKQFTAASSDAELRKFIHVLQSGTEQEQRAAVDAAGEKGLRADPEAR
jgi:hypothetical protein